MLFGRGKGWIFVLQLTGHDPISEIMTPSWDHQLCREAPTQKALTVAGRAWAYPHDPTHAEIPLVHLFPSWML